MADLDLEPGHGDVRSILALFTRKEHRQDVNNAVACSDLKRPLPSRAGSCGSSGIARRAVVVDEAPHLRNSRIPELLTVVANYLEHLPGVIPPRPAQFPDV